MPRVCHFEIPVDDVERSVKFYTDLFGWSIQKWDKADYYLVSTGEEGPGINGGLMKRMHPGQPLAVAIDVADVDATCAKIVECGGMIVVPKMSIPTVGYLAYFKDTEGNIHGIMQFDSSAA